MQSAQCAGVCVVREADLRAQGWDTVVPELVSSVHTSEEAPPVGRRLGAEQEDARDLLRKDDQGSTRARGTVVTNPISQSHAADTWARISSVMFQGRMSR